MITNDSKSSLEEEPSPSTTAKQLYGVNAATADATATNARPSGWDVFLGRDRSRTSPTKMNWRDLNSIQSRLSEIFTTRFLLCLLAGQSLSVAITSTSVLTTLLYNNNWSMPTFQTFFLYFFLNLIYTPYTIYRYGFKAYGQMLLSDGWKYFFLAAVDVEANFLVVKAYGYTDLLSAMLLDAFAVPSCMIFAWFLMKTRYHYSQIIGVVVCLVGLGLLVTSDYLTGKNYDANSKVIGDVCMIFGAIGYGLSNSLEEYFVRRRPLYEIIGQLGLYGMIINGIQGAALEHDLFSQISWEPANIGYLAGYTCAMLFLYTLAPILFRLSSSPFYNLSILTSDFYGLAFGLGMFGYSPYPLYFVAYVLTLVGLIIYFSVTRPEVQEIAVVSRGRRLEAENESGKVMVIGGVKQ